MLQDQLSDQVGCILIIGEAALAADLITQLIFKHLEQNLASQEWMRKSWGPIYQELAFRQKVN